VAVLDTGSDTREEVMSDIKAWIGARVPVTL